MKLLCLLATQAPKGKQLLLFLLLHLVSYLFISVTERRDSFIKTLRTKRDSWQNDFTCVYSTGSGVSMAGSLTSLVKWILARKPACVLMRDNSLACRPRFALFCQRQEVTIAGAWGHDGEVKSRLNGLFNSTSLVPRRCYCTWCKTAQVALIQRAHAAGPRTLSASQ